MVKKNNEGNCTIRYEKRFASYLKKDNFVKYMFLALLFVVVVLTCLSLYGIKHYLTLISMIDWIIFVIIVANALIMMTALSILLSRNYRILNALKDEEYYDEKTIRNSNSNDKFVKIYRIIVLMMAITFSIGAVVFFALKFESFMTGTEISIMPMLIIFLAVSSWVSFSNLSYENYLEKNLYVDYDEN